jgi:hypothetical protein
MESFEDFKELLVGFAGLFSEPSHVIYLVLVAIGYIIEIILLKKGVLCFDAKQKRRDQAFRLNQFVQAKRISYNLEEEIIEVNDERKSDFYYEAEYEYVMNGERRIYKYCSRVFPEAEITLYYLDDPRDVFHYQSRTPVWFVLIYFIPVIAAVLIMSLLGIELK